MIKPVNNHILIEPLKHDSFISSEKGTYEEVGIVMAVCDELGEKVGMSGHFIKGEVKIGDKVYFDSWLAGKFPTGQEDTYFWLVSWKDVKAVEYGN